MGWIWLIPAFHMPQPSSAQEGNGASSTTIRLTRKEIDFPIGLGAGIVDVEISMEWVDLTRFTRQQDLVASPVEEEQH